MRRRLTVGAAFVGPSVLVLAGCGQTQNSLEPQSHQARDIASLFWWMMGGAWIGLGLVVGLLILSRVRANRRGFGRDSEGAKPGERAGWYVVIGAGVVMPIVVISALFIIGNFFVLRTTEAPAQSATTMTVQVIGHQWWWEFRYAASGAVTANEMHIPVHTPVRIDVRAADVIHSFWVPELNRKIDMFPAKVNAIELNADRTGRYRGECAEFCGLQHAHMSFYVFVDSPSAFRKWQARQAARAAAPQSALARRGQSLFASGTCSSCHAVRGTGAAGYVGPDLTHVASRTTIGALTLPNGKRELREWIANSQHYKPGNQMPNIDVSKSDLDALVAYMQSLR